MSYKPDRRTVREDIYRKFGEMITCPKCKRTTRSELWAYSPYEYDRTCVSSSCGEPNRLCPTGCGYQMWHGTYDASFPAWVDPV